MTKLSPSQPSESFEFELWYELGDKAIESSEKHIKWYREADHACSEEDLCCFVGHEILNYLRSKGLINNG